VAVLVIARSPANAAGMVGNDLFCRIAAADIIFRKTAEDRGEKSGDRPEDRKNRIKERVGNGDRIDPCFRRQEGGRLR